MNRVVRHAGILREPLNAVSTGQQHQVPILRYRPCRLRNPVRRQTDNVACILRHAMKIMPLLGNRW